jgi:uncharacterized phiE125 gp8 family phage protein
MYGLLVSAVPGTEPIDLNEVKQHMRVDGDEENALILAYITTARLLAENYCQRSFIQTQWKWYLDSWFEYAENANVRHGRFVENERLDGDYIRLPRSPLISVDSIEYQDVDGITRTVNALDYLVDNKREPGRIIPVIGKSWPSIKYNPNAITVTFKAGYGANVDNVPQPIRTALMYLAGHFYETRNAGSEDTIPFHVKAMLEPYRLV